MAHIRNVSPFEATVRILLGLVLLGRTVTLGDRPFLAIAWGSVALLVLGTGLLRICPVYALIRGARSARPRAAR